MQTHTVITTIGLLNAILVMLPSSAAVELVRNGKAVAAIQLSAREAEEVEEAAGELALYFGKISGAEVPVRRLPDDASPGRGVVLGKLADRSGVTVGIQTVSREAFRIVARGDQVMITGESPVAVRHGAYKLLEILGVRWFTPGELGEVVPQSRSIVVDDLDLLDQPDAPYRRFWYGGKLTRGEVLLWNKRNRNAGYRGGSFAHAWGRLVPREMFDAHPEYFSLNKGQRTARQLCTTNSEVARVAAQNLVERMAASDDWIFPAGPNDGGGLCECDTCRALDTPDYLEPSSGLPCCSDRILDFANRIAERTARQHPDRMISFLVYSEYSRLPQKIDRVHENVIPMIAPIRRCRFHGPDHPLCPSAQLLGDEIRGWAQRSRQIGFYPYNYNLADALLPSSKIAVYKRYQQILRQLDPKPRHLAWDFETLDAWSIYAPHLYLSARMMWDIDLDIDAVMEDFYGRFYGPAAAPMREYWQSLDAAYDQTPAHAGSYFDQHLIFTAERLDQWERQMAEARRSATAEPYATRVAMAAAGLRCARHFIRIRDALNECRFQEAKREKGQLFAHLDAMAEHTDPDWTHTRYSKGYFETFLGRTVDGGAALLESGGRIVTALPDAWRFCEDPQDEGRRRGWYGKDFDDSAWRTLRTRSASWAEQGLGEYRRRPAWYRVSIEVPAQRRGRDVRLWFGGVDEQAEVYVNGQLVGETRGFARPFEFPVGPVLQYGTGNVIAVRCLSESLAELGTGGILRPVVLYAAQP